MYVPYTHAESSSPMTSALPFSILKQHVSHICRCPTFLPLAHSRFLSLPSPSHHLQTCCFTILYSSSCLPSPHHPQKRRSKHYADLSTHGILRFVPYALNKVRQG